MVVLLSGKSKDPVRVRLQSTCLNMLEENSIIYNAVSYTWSREDRDFPMILNGKPIKVTKQLGELFEEARDGLSDDETSTWWIDQLCINQDDDEDKAQQIPHMRTIYEKAKATVVYLRPSIEDGDLAIDLILRLANLAQRSESGAVLHQLPLSEILGPSNEENIRSWRALKQFMSHRYWTRTWILPEAIARVDRCLVVCSTLERGLYIRHVFWIRNLVRQLYTRSPPREYLMHAIPSSLVGRVENFGELQASSETEYTALFDLLDIARRRECSRPEDKIFAMLPFAGDVGDHVNDEFLKPSYADGCFHTYTNLVKWYLLKYRNCRQFLDFDLPSLVPNWTHATHLTPFAKYHERQASIGNRAPLYSACGPFSHSIEVVEPPNNDYTPHSLFLSGLRIATVHKVLEPAIDGGFWQPEIEMSWRHEFDGSVEYPLTAETCHDAFERTVVADVTYDLSNGRNSRPGRVNWQNHSTEVTPLEKHDQDHHLKAATGDRRLFFARSSTVLSDVQTLPSTATGDSSLRPCADSKTSLMGLGRSDVEVGDEIWALKGGRVLYVLRPRSSNHMVSNIASSPEPGWPNCPSLIWLNGRSYSWSSVLSGRSFKLVGECYVHGLLDGEALDIAPLPPAERPESLRDMSSDFEEIFVGGRMRRLREALPKPDNPEALSDICRKVLEEAKSVGGDLSDTEYSEVEEVY